MIHNYKGGVNLLNKNEFSKIHHEKIKELGYWDTPREIGTLLMLMVTEIAKLFDQNRLNKSEKLADLALRIYDYSYYNSIDLSILPEIDGCDLLDMITTLTNELESFRVGLDLNGIYIKQCLSMAYKYAEKNNINLEDEMIKKHNILHKIRKRLI